MRRGRGARAGRWPPATVCGTTGGPHNPAAPIEGTTVAKGAVIQARGRRGLRALGRVTSAPRRQCLNCAASVEASIASVEA